MVITSTTVEDGDSTPEPEPNTTTPTHIAKQVVCFMGKTFVSATVPLGKDLTLKDAVAESISLQTEEGSFTTTTEHCTANADGTAATCWARVDDEKYTGVCSSGSGDDVKGATVGFSYPERVNTTACPASAIRSAVVASADGVGADQLGALGSTTQMHGMDAKHCMPSNDDGNVWCTACVDADFELESTCPTASDAQDREECSGLSEGQEVMLYDARFHCVIVGDTNHKATVEAPDLIIKAGFRKVYATCTEAGKATGPDGEAEVLVSKSAYKPASGPGAMYEECRECSADMVNRVRGEPYDACETRAEDCNNVVAFSDPRYRVSLRRVAARGGALEEGEELQIVCTASGDAAPHYLAALQRDSTGEGGGVVDKVSAKLRSIVKDVQFWNILCNDSVVFTSEASSPLAMWSIEKHSEAPRSKTEPGGKLETAHPSRPAVFYSIRNVLTGQYLRNRPEDDQRMNSETPWHHQDKFEDSCWPSHDMTDDARESKFLLVAEDGEYPSDFVHDGRDGCEPCQGGICYLNEGKNNAWPEYVVGALAGLVASALLIAFVWFFFLK